MENRVGFFIYFFKAVAREINWGVGGWYENQI